MTGLSDAEFLGSTSSAPAHGSQGLSDDEFLGASSAKPAAAAHTAETKADKSGKISEPSFGRALGYGIANAVPFAHDIGATIQAGESYLPKALQTDDLGDVDNSASFGDRWKQQKARIEATDAANQQAYPVTSFVTPLATSVLALPMAGPVDALSSGIARVAPKLGGLAADSLATGAVGASYGAAYGAGEGDTLGERLGNAKTGTLLGGIGGAATPALVKGAASIGNAGSKFVKGVFNPEAAGADAAIETIARDQAGGSGVKMTPQQIAAAQAAGQPIVAGDTGGEATRRLARTASNVSPEAKAKLQDPLASRFASQNTRLNDFVDNLYGSNVDAETMKQNLAQRARPANDANYRQANADAAARPAGVWTPDRPVLDANGDPVPSLPDLVNHPRVQQAIKDATKVAQEDAVSRGIQPVRNPFVPDANGNMVLGTQPNGSQAIPGLPFWDYVQRGLRTQKEQAFASGDKDAARRIGVARDQVLANLDDLVPSFAKARQGAFEAFGADNALDAGANILRPTITPTQVQQAVAAATTPLQKQALDYGAATAVVNKAVNASDGRDIVKLFETPAIREKLQAAMQPGRFAQLEAYLRAEASMNLLKNAVSGNSTTAEQAHGIVGMAANTLMSPVAGAIEGAALGYHEHGFDPSEMLKYGALGALGGMMRKAYSGVNARMMQSVAETLASSDPTVVNAAIGRIAKNKQMMEALRRVSSHLAAAPAAEVRQVGAPSQPTGG